jgi:membrane-bound lytic murein transglycosylase B
MIHGILLAAAISGATLTPIDEVKAKLTKKGFTETEISTVFSDPRLEAYPQKSVNAKPVNWKKYQTQILTKSSLKLGAAFIAKHQAAFTAAQKKYGVPQEMIAAVMRIETGFGSYVGTYSVPNVFYTFLVNGKKVAWAEDNFVALMEYAKREQIDAFALKGSYAGAIGYPQFLPSSIMAFGVDGDGNGKTDLMTVDDAVPSLANFLAEHGYAKNPKKALTSYYGSSVGYPAAGINYAAALKRLIKSTKK